MFLSLIACTVLMVDQPPVVSPIRLPNLASVDPKPSPMPSPNTPSTLSLDRLYVIDSSVPVIVKTLPAGRVITTKDTGPIRIRGLFADGGTRVETRTFAGPYVTIIEGTHAGRVDVVIIPVGVKDDAEVIVRSLNVVDSNKPEPKPLPNPTPKPDPKPEPKPTPKPSSVAMKFVVIEETADSIPSRSAIFDDAALKKRWVDMGHSRPVIVDKDVIDPATNQRPASLVPYFERAKDKKLPYLFVLDAKTMTVLYDGAAPETPAKLLELISQYGG